MKKFFKYFEPAWTGNDGKVSLRAILAIAFSIDFIRNLSHAIWKWDAGRSMEGLSLTLGIEAGLIVGLLGLTTYQNMQMFSKNPELFTNNSKDEVNKVEGKNDSIEQ